MATAYAWTPPPSAFVTTEEYLDFEADAGRHGGIKSEYIYGHIRPMTEMGVVHIQIHSNLVGLLIVASRGRPFKAIGPEIPLRTSADGPYYYADVLVAPRPLESHLDRGQSPLDPISVFEITFPSTDMPDRREKLRNYARIETLRDYVIVADDHVHVEHFTRDGDREWQSAVFNDPAATLALAGFDVAVPLAEIYHAIEFDLPEDASDSSRG